MTTANFAIETKPHAAAHTLRNTCAVGPDLWGTGHAVVLRVKARGVP